MKGLTVPHDINLDENRLNFLKRLELDSMTFVWEIRFLIEDRIFITYSIVNMLNLYYFLYIFRSIQCLTK
jgi:hypothetical protein